MQLEEKIRQTVRQIPDFPKKGILFRDITPVFSNAELCNEIATNMAENLAALKPDAIVGIESRGFLFGMLLANKLNLPFVMVRKAGKLPHQTVSQEYVLEYGSAKIEIHTDSIKPGWQVVIHDDLLATGGTAEAAAQLVEKMNAKVCAFSFIIALDELNGEHKLKNYSTNIACLVHY